MPAFLKYLLLGIIGLICLGIGFVGSTAYFSTRGAFDGFAYSCKILDVAEKKGVLTKAQRATVAVDAGKVGAGGSDQLAQYLNSDCTKTPFQAMSDAKK